MKTLYDVVEGAQDELEERYKEICRDNDGECDIDDLGDVVHEVADSHLPIYYCDIWSVAGDNFNDLVLAVPEIEPNERTPIGIMTANIFEYLTQELYEYAVELTE